MKYGSRYKNIQIIILLEKTPCVKKLFHFFFFFVLFLYLYHEQ